MTPFNSTKRCMTFPQLTVWHPSLLCIICHWPMSEERSVCASMDSNLQRPTMITTKPFLNPNIYFLVHFSVCCCCCCCCCWCIYLYKEANIKRTNSVAMLPGESLTERSAEKGAYAGGAGGGWVKVVTNYVIWRNPGLRSTKRLLFFLSPNKPPRGEEMKEARAALNCWPRTAWRPALLQSRPERVALPAACAGSAGGRAGCLYSQVT